MPINKALYPADWDDIALKVKIEADFKCQECDRPCRLPEQSWEKFKGYLLTHEIDSWYDQACEYANVLGQWKWLEKRQRFTLTVSHSDHNPSNCDRSNLRALCSVCHLRYDANHHARSRRKKVAGQLTLFSGDCPS